MSKTYVTMINDNQLLEKIERVSEIKVGSYKYNSLCLTIKDGKISWGNYEYYADLKEVEFLTNSRFIEKCKEVSPKKPEETDRWKKANQKSQR